MDSLPDADARAPVAAQGDDLSAIAWVHDELRRSLDAAHKSLRRFLKDAEAVTGSDLDAVDPGVLRNARTQIHQGVGALELVGLPAPAIVLRASEAAVQRAIARPAVLGNELVSDIEKSSYGLLDYLSRLLAGKHVSALSLFPQYRAVQEAVEAERVHPADLWTMDWRWREVEVDADVVARRPDAAVHAEFESQLLRLMRGTQALTAAAKMSEISAGLASGSAHPHVRTFWSLAAAMFEAQHHGLVVFDVFTKRVASRLLAQFRILERGDSDVSERLARDVLFFCSQAAPAPRGTLLPRLAAVRDAYGLVEEPATDYSVSVLGRFDPTLIGHAKKRVVAAKEGWSAVAGGEMHRLSGLGEQFALVGDSLRKLFPFGEAFATELQGAAQESQQSQAAPAASLAMEVATSLLYIEAALEDGDFDDAQHASRTKRLAERLAAVRAGRAPDPLEPWMEDLYRRVSDRQTMGSVVQELRASLAEAEKAIDQFFRDPKQHGVLVGVPVQFQAMRGVLSVLGMEHASQALLRMRDEVDRMAVTEVDEARVAQAGVFDRLAGNLSALGFLIDMLSVQPQLAKSLFVYDPEAGVLSPVMGRTAGAAKEPTAAPVEPRLLEQAQLLAFTSVRDDVPLQEITRDLERLSHEAQAADQPALAAAVLKAQEALGNAKDPEGVASARGELSEALVDFVATANEPTGIAPVVEAEPAAPIKPIAIVESLEHDDEMRDIFLEEAREVIETAKAASAELKHAPDDIGQLTTVRRAFHTLKGSSRMVGLRSFGEAAWACEQVFNSQLADPRGAEPPLIEFTDWVLDYLLSWVDDIARHDDASRSEGEVKIAADRLARRLQAGESSSDIALPFGLPAGLPSRSDLDLVAARETSAEAPAAGEDLSFELDLSGFDAKVASAGTNAKPLGGVDPAAPAMFDRFDDANLPELVADDERLGAPVASGFVDLDLGVAADAAPLIESLEPSTLPTGEASEFGIGLDLAPADAPAPTPLHAGDGVDFEIGEPASTSDEAGAGSDENVKVVGPLRIGIPLFNIYLNEADELSRRLTIELSEWAMELHRPVGESTIALAHSLAGSSATVGFGALSQLARSLEHALARSQVIGRGTEDEARLFVDAAEEIRRLLHQFAAGFLKDASPDLIARLADHELSSAKRLDAITAKAELDDGTTTQPPAVGVEPISKMISLDGIADVEPPAAHAPGVAPSAEPARASHEPTTETEASPAPSASTEATAHAPFHAASEDADEETRPAELRIVDPSPPEVALPSIAAAAPAAASEPEHVDEPDVADNPWSSPSRPMPFEAQPSSFAPMGGLGVAELKPLAAAMPEGRAVALPRSSGLGDLEDDIDAVDAVDPELFPIFEEEAQELLPRLTGQLREWARQPAAAAHPAACMRTLHTLKGGARLAGAMRLGEMAHRLETRIERLGGEDAEVSSESVEELQARADVMVSAFEALKRSDAQAYADAVAAASSIPQVASRETVPAPLEPAAAVPSKAAPSSTSDAAGPSAAKHDALEAAATHHPERAAADAASGSDERPASEPERDTLAANDAQARQAELPSIDWSRFAVAAQAPVKPAERAQTAAHSAVRVRAPVLDRLVNQAGEVSITRSRIETGVGQLKGSLGDLTENLERLRGQLRDIELQGEVQMSSRIEAAKAASQAFDPLEFDRFTRFQELTRMMAESVNDVATVQRTLQRSIESTEDELVAQARLTRDLQDDLLRTRMVEFEGLSDRLYRVVRLAAKETGKQVRLDLVGGSIEVDRGVLDRMTGAFEHLLRNCVTHGIEAPAARTAAGKEATGTIVVSLTQEGNEVGVEFRDDGAGLDLAKIRAKGIATKMLDPAAKYEDGELANLIFTPGFSTADVVTELAGRGVGMDVVRSEVIAMGGRIETATAAGQGTSFKLILPLTTAVTQVVMLRCGAHTVAVPSTLIEIVRRASAAEVDAAYASGAFEFGDRALPFFWLGALLQLGARPSETQSRTRPVVVVRSAQQRIALHVDEVLGNQEVVVKNLGPQLSRLPGLAGMTLLASGTVALIYNPVALATLYGEGARTATLSALQADGGKAPGAARPGTPAAPRAPLILVVDDSLTVRRVTQRLLVREGYRVSLAKDGLDALERLAEELPQVVLSDIEMPRMDGFDLVRNLRADARWRELPVIMITSRIAQKHRDHAVELGVDHYLGKPYSEEDLLALIGRYVADAQATA